MKPTGNDHRLNWKGKAQETTAYGIRSNLSYFRYAKLSMEVFKKVPRERVTAVRSLTLCTIVPLCFSSCAVVHLRLDFQE